MTKAYEDLKGKVLLILGQFKSYHRIYKHTERELTNERLRLAKNPDDEPAVDFNDTTVVNEQVLLLKTLRGQGGHTEEDFVKILSEAIHEDNAPVVVHTLVEVGRLDAVLAMVGKTKLEELELPAEIWSTLGEKLRREPHRFTDADLDAISKVRGADERTMRTQQKRRLGDATTI
jgi:hypothetical protein